MITWAHRDLAMAIHDRQIADHGGNPGVRDVNLLELALARPQQLYALREPRPDLAELAATLAFGLARNHPFVDGNKRTAFVCYRTFLALNDVELDASIEQKVLTIAALAEGKLSERKFADWLRVRMSEPRPRIQERKARYKVRAKAKRK